MFKLFKSGVFLVTLFLLIMVFTSLVTAKDIPKLYTTKNVLAAGNYNEGTSSSDISLIIQVEADGKIVIDEGASVKYIVPQADEKGWTEIKFDDSKWLDGISGVGFADGDDNTIVPVGAASIYTRYLFNVANASSVKQLIFRVDYDDAYIIWLNGAEVARTANIAALSPVGQVPKWDVSAARGAMGGHEASNLPAGKPNKDRWNHARIVTHIVEVSFGGHSSLSVEPQDKLAETWGNLKRLPW